ncbi:FtsB family cell division protein [Balneola vulgaris]|jgi:cell division protein FtsB|uniref:FtsB family cell division protein n=1 Tax=Balneola vulgaris TaxID=287535 RepID=UPI00035C2666|nr:septum formation initiator family protein [Balneola vulgaris]
MNTAFFNPIHWKKSFLVVLLLSFVLIWFGFIDSYSLLARFELNSKKADLNEKIEKLNASSDELKEKIENLNNDAALLEKIAREEYGMRKPGETVYKIKRTK